MSVRMKMTRSKTGNRRSHHHAVSPRLSVCSHCEAKHVRHTMCKECGHYRESQVVDVTKQLKKKQARAAQKNEQKKEIAEGKAPVSNKREEAAPEEKPTAEGLAK